MTIWVRSSGLRLQGLGPDQGESKECLFGNVDKTKVVRDDENRYFKLFPDVHDHLGEVQPPPTPRSGTGPRGVPWNDFLAMLLKQKLLGLVKVVILSCFRMYRTIWVKSRPFGLQGLGPDKGGSQGIVFWECC